MDLLTRRSKSATILASVTPTQGGHMGLLLMVAAAWAVCPEFLPDEYATDEHSSGRVIMVVKDEHLLGVYENDRLMAGTCVSITMGSASQEGTKQKRGDNRTPEGWYKISHRNPYSQFHKSLGINYPNFDDVMRARLSGLIDHHTSNTLVEAINKGRLPAQDTVLGGDIFLHGNPGNWTNDWTWGCVALRNTDMDALYRLGDPGTAVLILSKLPEVPEIITVDLTALYPTRYGPYLEEVRDASIAEQKSVEP